MARQILKTLLFLIAAQHSGRALAGYFEINANGSYYKYDNGLSSGKPSTTTVKRWGGGLAYRFLQNTSIELSYSNSTNNTETAYVDTSADATVYANQDSKNVNISLSLILEFAEKNSAFKPFIRGGGGYMTSEIKATGFKIDHVSLLQQPVNFENKPKSGSASAEAGLGFKVYVSNSTAIEFTATAFGSDLDKPIILLNYAVTGGLRYLFQ